MSFTSAHALLIGVGSFTHHPAQNVEITTADAAAVEAVLRNPDLCGYPADQVRLLSRAAATRAGIEQALAGLATQVDAGSTVFLFLCSHGAIGTDGNWYFNPHDVRYDGKRVIPESGISEGQLIELLRGIPAERLFVVFNTCFSGSVSPTLAGDVEKAIRTTSPTPDGVEALLATGRGRIIITAAGEDQYSFFTHGQPLTIFTRALVDGLKGSGVRNQNGFVNAFDLYTHVYESVREEVRSRYNETQEPELTVLKGVGPFAVSLYRGAAASLGDFRAEKAPPEMGRINAVSEQRIGRAVTNILGEKAQQFFAGGDLQVGGNVIMGDQFEGNQYRAERDMNINTGGGAFVGGGVSTSGGEFIGRDKIVGGDEVRGDKSGGDKITVGDIKDAQGVAIGREARAEVHIKQGLGAAEIARLFAPLRQRVRQAVGEEEEQAARQKIEALENEVAKGEDADDEQMAGLIQDLADLAPPAVEKIVKLFTSSVVARLAGGATRFVVGRLKRR